MRRMSNRTPPFALVGLVVICFILGYNYWTVSSQNGDLKKEIEKLQTQVKMGGLKQEQLENKNAALQGNVHNMASENNALSSRLKQQLTDDEEQIKNVQTELKQKVYEITSLKKDLLKQQEIERDLQQQLESKDMKLEENQKNVERILSLKNDADEALAERDSNIIELKTTVQRLNEQLKIASARKDDLVPEPPKPGAFNIPNNDKKGSFLEKGSLDVARKKFLQIHNKGQEGIKWHRNAQILPLQSPNSQKAKPRFSIMNLDVDNNIDNNIPDFGKPIDEIKDPQNNVIQNPPIFKSEKDEPKPNLAPVEGVLKQPDLFNNSPIIGNDKNEHVLPPPLQNPEENPDTAIDDAEKVIDDPLDDQDEEGKEIKRDMNKAEENYDNYDEKDEKIKLKDYNGPSGIGNMGLPKSLREKQANANDLIEDHKGEILDDQLNNGKFLHRLKHNNEVHIGETGSNEAHENIYDNFENKIRNLNKNL